MKTLIDAFFGAVLCKRNVVLDSSRQDACGMTVVLDDTSRGPVENDTMRFEGVNCGDNEIARVVPSAWHARAFEFDKTRHEHGLNVTTTKLQFSTAQSKAFRGCHNRIGMNRSQVQVHATEARQISLQQTAAAAANALALEQAAAQAREEQEARVVNERRRLARIKADNDRQSFVNAIYIAARLGKTSTYFGAVQEDDDFYWDYIAEHLRDLGYDVDIRFIEERRRFNDREAPVGPRWPYDDDSRPTHAIELIEVNRRKYYRERQGESPCDCCEFYLDDEDFAFETKTMRKIKTEVNGVTISRCWLIEILWMLLVLPVLMGCCWWQFGFLACVRDDARTRVTCNAPTTVLSGWSRIGAVWFVRVSWDAPVRAPASAVTVRAPEPAPVLSREKMLAQIPVAMPIDA